jgi:hypothetical protein
MTQAQTDSILLKDQLLTEIAALPTDRLGAVLNFVRSVQTSPATASAATHAWAEFFQIGEAIAALDQLDTETSTAAVMAMRR